MATEAKKSDRAAPKDRNWYGANGEKPPGADQQQADAAATAAESVPQRHGRERDEAFSRQATEMGDMHKRHMKEFDEMHGRHASEIDAGNTAATPVGAEGKAPQPSGDKA